MQSVIERVKEGTEEAAAIDYAADLTIEFENLNNVKWTLAGSHDGFPCYEFYLNSHCIYSHDSGNKSPLSLLAGQEETINASGQIQVG